MRRAVGVAQENPLGLALASVAAGVLIGSLLPRTRIEDERVGPIADTLKERAGEVAHEAVEHGREAAAEVAGAVREHAGEAVREHGSAVADRPRGGARARLQPGRERARERLGGRRRGP